jgi:succinate dehydrogenase cytochrome b subunit
VQRNGIEPEGSQRMISSNRPLSPHLQVYRPQITSTLSILHRVTGVALAVGMLLLTYWLISAASGPEAFATAQDLIGSFIGRLLLFGWTFALFYHLCNGIRHLFWDAGYGFEIETAQRSGWVVVGASVVLTLICWIAGYLVMGG